jgi:hypothetical protein
LPLQAGEFRAAEQKYITTPTINSNLKLSASICAFSDPFVLTCRSGNRQASFHLWSQRQANEVLRHGLPKFRLMDHDISVGLFYLSMRFLRLEQPFDRLTSSIAFQSRPDAHEGFHQPASASP